MLEKDNSNVEKKNESNNIESDIESHIKSRILVCSIEGMTCTSCSGSVEGLLIPMKGVIEATISLATNTAHIEYVPSSHLNAQIIIDSIQEIGFGAEIFEDYEVKKLEKNIRNRKRNVRSLILSIDGMTCSSCQRLIENTLNDLEDVIEASVVLATNTAYIEYIPNDNTTTQFLINAIEEIGFGAEMLDDTSSKKLYNVDALINRRECLLQVEGMMCTCCQGTAERALGFIGAINAKINLLQNIAYCEYIPSKILSSSSIINAIESVGFDAKLLYDRSIVVPILRMLVIEIEGMMCECCESTVNNSLKIVGVETVQVKLKESKGYIEYNPSASCNPNLIVKSLEDSGFGVVVLEDYEVNNEDHTIIEEAQLLLTITINNKVIINKEELINFLSLLEGVVEVGDVSKFNSEDSKNQWLIRVLFNENITGPRKMLALAKEKGNIKDITVTSFGGFMIAGRLKSQQDAEARSIVRQLLISTMLTVPIVCITMVFPMIFMETNEFFHQALFYHENYPCLYGLLLVLLCTPVEFWVGWRFHKKAFIGAYYSRTFGMDFLVSTGTGAAYFYSFYSFIKDVINNVPSGKDVEYFETSAVLITVILFGKYLEIFAKGKTASAIHDLSNQRARFARLIVDPNQKEQSNNNTIDNSIDKNNSKYTLLNIDDNEEIKLNKSETDDIIKMKKLSQLGFLGEEDINEYQNINDVKNRTKDDVVIEFADDEEVIDVSLIQKGDILRLVAGESIPADGTLQCEFVGVDESMLTGESRTINKTGGQKVYGGSMVVEGSGLMLVEAVGDNSALGKIMSMVQDAQASKLPIQEIADKVASYFVPVVTIISIITFIVWITASSLDYVPLEWFKNTGGNSTAFSFSFFFALAVWVSACPCAFGLATPTAILVSTGVAAKNGVLVRRGAALQFASEVNVVAFDKTGTLTNGKTEVTDFILLNDDGDQIKSGDNYKEEVECIKLLLSAESRSSHPLARGITTWCRFRLKELSALYKSNDEADKNSSNLFTKTELIFEVVPGQGIRMLVRDIGTTELLTTVVVGSEKLLDSENIIISSNSLSITSNLRQDAKVVIFMGMNGKLKSIVGLADTVRDESATVLAMLQKRGIECYMITGDDITTALAIGQSLGIPKTHILARASPEDKEAKISSLQKEGKLVAFVGDGTNDSPALATAHVGIAMASGTDIAIESGDLILCKSDLCALMTAIDLSRTTLRRIKINYFWALIYNIILIPIAAGLFYPSYKIKLDPMLAGAAMALSSVSIVASSLLLMLYNPPDMNAELYKEYIVERQNYAKKLLSNK